MIFRELISPEYVNQVEEHFSSSLQRDYFFEGIPIRKKDGSKIITIAWSSSIILNDKIVGVYIICQDMTEQKQTEELLKKSEKLSMVGELAAGIA
ncbi:PAS domain S-box protein [Ammoniphilus sp. 3BR4]|uniref:PAS domain S-box protein n=1 Tax=Ammoniphilus sp. 3BR4 TaxID=3158265 RepID=UPI003465DF4C